MNTGTWNGVLRAVEDLPFASAEEIAEQAELSTTTVRKYLAEMVERGLVVSRDELRESETRYGRTRLVHIAIFSPAKES
jgi:predicted ArsR family transcriptional regulator